MLETRRVWGEDALLPQRDFAIVDHSQAVALTFCECMLLRRHDFVRVGNAFPDEMAKIRKRMRNIVLQRYLILSLSQVGNDVSPGDRPRTGFATCRSFIRCEDAQGYTYLVSWRTEPDESGFSPTSTRLSSNRKAKPLDSLDEGCGPHEPRGAASLDGSVHEDVVAPHAAHGRLEETTSRLVDMLRDMQAAQARMDAQLQLFDQRLDALRAATPIDVNVQVLPDGAVQHARETTS